MADGDGGTGPDQGQPGDKGGEGDAGKKDDFQPITYKTQEELDAAFGERATRAANAARTEALKAFTDAGVSVEDAIAAAAAQKAAEDAKKSPATLEREKREAAERELEKYKSKEARAALATEVAKTVTVGDQPLPASLLAGDTKEEMEAFAKSLVDFINSVAGPRGPRHNPDQGHSQNDQASSGDPVRNWMSTGVFA